MPSEEEIEAAARAIMISDNCGYTVKGKRVMCTDDSINEAVDAYGERLKRCGCDCRNAAKAALEASEKVRNKNATDQHNK